MSERVCVGAIAGAFGVRGEVRLKSFCAEPESIGAYSPLYDEKGERQFTVRITQSIKNGFAARLSGVTSKEAADALKGVRLYADRDALPNLPDDEFYHTDLIGLDVLDAGGEMLGRVKAVLNHGAGDILEVNVGPGKPAVLVPFTLAIVPTIDLEAKRLIVDPPEELFD